MAVERDRKVMVEGLIPALRHVVFMLPLILHGVHTCGVERFSPRAVTGFYFSRNCSFLQNNISLIRSALFDN